MQVNMVDTVVRRNMKPQTELFLIAIVIIFIFVHIALCIKFLKLFDRYFFHFCEKLRVFNRQSWANVVFCDD